MFNKARSKNCAKRLAASKSDYKPVEEMLKLALRQVESEEGEDSASAGLLILELCDLYEKQGREQEAVEMWQRLRQILTVYYPGAVEVKSK